MLPPRAVVNCWLVVSFALSSTACPGNNGTDSTSDDCVDVVIIGGGSAGTYTAVRLAQENKTVAVIEKQDRLGGSVATFVDAKTNQTSDYGVIIYHNTSIVNNFFNFLGDPLVVDNFGNGTTKYANFASDQQINQTGINPLAIGEAIERIAELDFPTSAGYQDLPAVIPDDLLLLLPEFLAKYNLTALGYLFNEVTLGYNLYAMPALYTVKLLNPSFLRGLTTGFLTTANHDNQLAFDKAAKFLGSSVYLQTEATQVKRQNDSVLVTIRTANETKTIQASYLLIAMPPYLQDLEQYLDITAEESSLFGQLMNHTCAGGVIQGASIPPNVEIYNSDPELPFGTFELPGLAGFIPTGINGFNTVYYVNNDSSPLLSDDQIQNLMLQGLDEVQKLFQYQTTASQPNSSKPEVVSFFRHSPFQQHVTASAIQDGFYQSMVGLQGKNRTYWTGATWVGHDSSTIWEYTEDTILPFLLLGT